MTCCPLCGSEFDLSGVVLIPERGLVMRGDKIALLTGREMALFQKIVDEAPRVLSQVRMLEHLYQLEQNEPELKIIDVFICKIRKKLKPLGLSIATHWGQGYSISFLEPVQVLKLAGVA